MNRQDCKYTPFYCEENIWHLSQDPAFSSVTRRVVFVSNPARKCAFFNQRGAEEDGFVIWDYHVFLLAGAEAWDLDSTLPFPCPLKRYLTATFRDQLPRWYLPWFRLVKAEDYVAKFASDRRHMRDAAGAFKHPPPPWPANGPADQHNLGDFIDMRQPFLGEVIDLGTFKELARQLK